MLFAWMLAGVLIWVGSVSEDRSGTTTTRVRHLDQLAATAIEQGLLRSPTFAALVETIESSGFVVYVESSRRLKGGMQGCLVHGGAGPRYLRVLLKTGLSLDERIEVLAHELQHVREVIDAGIVNDPAAMQQLFARIGYNKRQQGGRQQEYETAAARGIAMIVARDLRSYRQSATVTRDHIR